MPLSKFTENTVINKKHETFARGAIEIKSTHQECESQHALNRKTFSRLLLARFWMRLIQGHSMSHIAESLLTTETQSLFSSWLANWFNCLFVFCLFFSEVHRSIDPLLSKMIFPEMGQFHSIPIQSIPIYSILWLTFQCSRWLLTQVINHRAT